MERPVVDWAQKHGWYTLKINGLGKRGFPDHFFFGKPRVLVMIEFKAPGKSAKPLQKYVHGILRGLGWPVYVVRDKEEGIDILRTEKARALASQALSRKSSRDDDGAGGDRPVPGPGAREN